MSRILVIGDLMVDRYRFFKPLRSDPANNVALVVESVREEIVDGGAGNLVRNLKSLCTATDRCQTITYGSVSYTHLTLPTKA